MKKLLLVLITLVCVSKVHADDPVLKSMDLYPLGSPMGSSNWQFAVDTSLMPAACVQRELHDGQWLAGICHDLIVVVRKDVKLFHTEAYALYNAEHGNGSYGLAGGVYVGAAIKSMMSDTPSNITLYEALSGQPAPKFVSYIDKISTLDFGAAYRPWHDSSVIGQLTYGPMFRVDIPTSDIMALLRSGL